MVRASKVRENRKKAIIILIFFLMFLSELLYDDSGRDRDPNPNEQVTHGQSKAD